MMAIGQDQDSFNRRVIVHHLSDLRYSSVDGNRQDDVLVKYQRYLEDLPDDREPDMIVITGDLTESGTTSELNAVAVALQTCFSRWSERLDKHVFIVPGPHDVNWESLDTVGLQAFYKVFGDFGFALPYRASMPDKRDTPANGRASFIGYPIDTCYAPDELTEKLQPSFAQYAVEYEGFVEQRARMKTSAVRMWQRLRWPRRAARVRAREAWLGRLRAKYLQLTENKGRIDLHAGRITQDDVARFERWAKQPTTPNTTSSINAASSVTAPTPLKVLIMYHPLAVRPEDDSANSDQKAAKLPVNQIARLAHDAGFHLALHGHIHNPQVLSDVSALAGQNNERVIRQVGAASLDATGVFNEVTAVYQELDGTGAWGLDLRRIDLKVNRSAMSPVVPLTSADAADKRIKALELAATQRSAFERATHRAMQRFSEQTYQARPTTTTRLDRLTGVPYLPQEGLLLVQEVIRNVILKDYDVRARLLLKSREKLGATPKLVPAYLSPAMQDNPDGLVYPASVAAWSLVLGRTLIFPEVMDEVTTAADNEWLRRTNKLSRLLPSVSLLMDQAASSSAPGLQVAARYSLLFEKLKNIESASDSADISGLAGEVIFQPASSGNRLPSYPWFICVPYPMRTGGGTPEVPEIAVLDVSVRQRTTSGSLRANAEAPSDPFTSERIEMLETLTELIGMMLTTADALDRPRGIWDDRI